MTYLDTRDLDEELTELEVRDLDAEDEDYSDEERAEFALTDEERKRLAELKDLRDEVGSEWSYGVTMIPVNDFEDYARELADDIGAIDDSHGWPLTCIDWERAARELAMDYTLVTYRGEDYYVRP